MRVLLDTHVLLWALADDPQLLDQARSIIADESNEVFYSVASAWEVSIKHTAHPDRMPASSADVISYCEQAAIEPLAISTRHMNTLETLVRPPDAPAHNDPFDRIMLAQAKTDGLLFLTHDACMSDYNEPCVLMV